VSKSKAVRRQLRPANKHDPLWYFYSPGWCFCSAALEHGSTASTSGALDDRAFLMTRVGEPETAGSSAEPSTASFRKLTAIDDMLADE
jgi:hypothetical protein